MRLSLLALAALVAAVPAGARGEVLPSPTNGPARAEDAGEPPAIAPEAAGAATPDAASRARKRSLPRWGAAVGAGFPDFATASLVFRPLPRVRIHAGPAWNYFGWGLQGGVTLVPWSFPITPLLSFQAGRFFGSDLSFLADDGDGEGAGMKPLLDDVVYSYAAADVGLEAGSQRGLCFTLRVGLSYVSVATHGTASRTSDGGTVVALSSPSLNATLPSLKLGVQYWF